jgi:hypothetical protein
LTPLFAKILVGQYGNIAMLGFLRETEEKAKKAGIDKDTGLGRTGLDTYLSKIFSNVHDWIHDKVIPYDLQKKRGSQKLRRLRPDYRSEYLSLIVEFDGVQHYTSPIIIMKDEESTKYYQSLGYKVARIPYFIQLSPKAIKRLFGVKLDKVLFDIKYPSLVSGQHTPAWLPNCGLERMARDFHRFPEQYRVNIKALEAANNETLSGAKLLKDMYESIEL